MSKNILHYRFSSFSRFEIQLDLLLDRFKVAKMQCSFFDHSPTD